MASGGRGSRRTPVLRPAIAAVVLLVVVAVIAIGLTGGTGDAKPAAAPSGSASHSPTAAATPTTAPSVGTSASGLSASAAGTEAADASVATTPFAGDVSVTGLTVTSLDDASLALSEPRLVFSGVRGSPYPPAKSLTLTNDTPSPLDVTNLRLAGPNPGAFQLANGQPTTMTIPAGGSVAVSITFHPANPVGCPTTAQPLA